jgi:hypothetical protein
LAAALTDFLAEATFFAPRAGLLGAFFLLGIRSFRAVPAGSG